MSVPGGGFNFGIGFITTAATAALNALGQHAAQTAQNIQNAFQRAQPNFNTQNARQQLNQLQQAAQNLGRIRVGLALEGHDQTAAGLRSITQLANNLSSQRAVVTLNLDDSRFARQIANARQFLQSLNRGDTGVLNLRMNETNLRRAMQELRNDIRSVEQRGVNLNVNAEGGRGGLLQSVLGGAGRGVISGSSVGGNLLVGAGALTATAAAGLAAAVAMERVTQATIEAFAAGLQYNAQLEIQTNTFRHFTSTAAEAAQLMAELRQISTRSPFGEAPVLASGATFLRTNPGDLQRVRELTELTTALAAARPELGFERVQQAMQQLISGDFRAFEDSTNIAIGSVRSLAATGVVGMEQYRRAVALAGGSTELLNANANSFQARLTTLQSTANALNAAFTRGAFNSFSGQLGATNAAIAATRPSLEALAEFLGEGLVRAVQYSLPPLQNLQKVLADLAAAGKFFQQAGYGAPAPGSAREQQENADPTTRRTQGTAEQIRENTKAQEEMSAAIARETQNHELVERQLKANNAAQKQITAEYAAQLIPLRQQLAVLQQPNFGLQRASIRNQQLQVAATQRVEQAQGSPMARAEVAGQLAVLEVEREIVDIRHARQDLTQRLAAAEQRVAQDQLQAQIRVREAALQRLRAEHEAHQEVRQVALERLREEVQAHQEARQVAIERLREESRVNQESRQRSLEGLREYIRGQQEARQESIASLREEQRVAQEARREALEAAQEQVRVRRDAYDQEKELRQEALAEEDRGYERESRSSQRANEVEQERFRRRIERMQDQDRILQRQERGDTPAERELKALEQLRTEQARARTLRDAEGAVLNARTGRERREALTRLEDVRREQAEERQAEELKTRAEQERNAREEAQYQTQERIRGLERQAQEADRSYQRDQQVREDAHREATETQQAAERARERTERDARRAEDEAIRTQETANRQQDKAEAAALREAERADKEQTKAEEAATRAAEASARAADKAEAEGIRRAEQADREATREENQRVKDAERIAKEADRAEQATIRAAEAALQATQQQNANAQAAIDATNNEITLQQLREIAPLEERRLAARQKLAEIKDLPLLGAATTDQALADIIQKTIDALIKADELTKNLAAINIQERIAQYENAIAARTQALEIAQADLEARVAASQVKIDQMKADLIALQQRGTFLTSPPQPGAFQDDVTEGGHVQPGQQFGPQGPAKTAGSKWATDFWGTFMSESYTLMVDSAVQIVAGLGTGLFNALTGDTVTSKAVADWANEKIIGTFKGTLGIESPSTVAMGWAGSIAEGFVLGMEEWGPTVTESLKVPFLLFETDFLPTIAPAWGEAAITAAQAFSDELTNSQMGETVAAHFEEVGAKAATGWGLGWTAQDEANKLVVATTLDLILLDMETLYGPKFQTQGTLAAQAWEEGFRLESAGMQATVMGVMDFVVQSVDIYGPLFEGEGTNMAIYFQNGWTGAMNNWQPYVPQPSQPAAPSGSGGGGGGGAPTGGGGRTGGGAAPGGGPYIVLPDGTTVPAGSSYPVPYAHGGQYQPGVPRLLHAAEIDMPQQGGTILPAEVTAGIRSLASIGRGGVGGGSNITLHITNHINGSQDPERVAEIVTERIIDILDQTQQQAGVPVPMMLPGAM